MSQRRQNRRARGYRREMLEALAEIGDSLLTIRDEDLWRADGFDSFEAYCLARVGERCPPVWRLNARQVAELSRAAIELAEQRHRTTSDR